jgi:hypothetical protein
VIEVQFISQLHDFWLTNYGILVREASLDIQSSMIIIYCTKPLNKNNHGAPEFTNLHYTMASLGCHWFPEKFLQNINLQ